MVKSQDYQILVNMMRRKMTVKSSLLEGLNTGVCYHSYCSINFTMVMCIRDLQYISIRQYMDTLIEYRIVILCSMNIEISAGITHVVFIEINT